jgi:hypothetical protein
VGCFAAGVMVLLRAGDSAEVVVRARCGVHGAVLVWMGWWIIVDSNLVLEQFADWRYKRGWLVLIRCGGG